VGATAQHNILRKIRPSILLRKGGVRRACRSLCWGVTKERVGEEERETRTGEKKSRVQVLREAEGFC